MDCSSAATDKAQSKAGKTELCEIVETQLTQLSEQEVKSSTEQVQVKGFMATAGARLSPFKRPRVSENDNLSTLQAKPNPRFGRSCKKCSEIRSSLKMEIANLRKENSKIVKNLREEICTLKRDKENLQNTVNFLQNMYTNFNITRKM